MSVYVRNDSEKITYLITGLEKKPKREDLFGTIMGEKDTRTHRYVLRPGEGETYYIKENDILGIEEL